MYYSLNCHWIPVYLQIYSFTWKKIVCGSPETGSFAWRKQAAEILGCMAVGVPCVQQLLLKALISTIWTLIYNLQFLWRHFTILSKYASDQSFVPSNPSMLKQGSNLMNPMGDQRKPWWWNNEIMSYAASCEHVDLGALGNSGFRLHLLCRLKNGQNKLLDIWSMGTSSNKWGHILQ